MNNYPPPFNQLFNYANCNLMGAWPDYLALGFTEEHIPVLIHLALDVKPFVPELYNEDEDNLEIWGPIHAWRVLGQLHAQDAIEPLIRLFHEHQDNDWVDDLLEIYPMFGPAIIPTIKAYIADTSIDSFPRCLVSEILPRLVRLHPKTRGEVIQVLMQQLEKFEENDADLNAFLVLGLVDSQAHQAIRVIKKAYRAKKVNESIAGTLEDIGESF